MSDVTPPDGPEHTTPLPDSFEVASSGPAEPEPSAPQGRKRGLILSAIVALVVLVLGGAAFAAFSFLNGSGPRPEEALPASTVAMMSVDLDPKAGQKIEAIKTLRKFPALRKSLGVDSTDDLRRLVLDEGLKECDGLDYDKSIEPWIGERAAVAGVDLGGKYPTPALLVQVSDKGKASDGVDDLIACAKDSGELPAKDFGYVVGDDYLVISDSGAHAKEILASAGKKSLADDSGYQKWSDAVDGQGIVNFYVAPSTGRFLGSAFDELVGGFQDELDNQFGVGSSDELDLSGKSGDPFAQVKDGLSKFKGAAGALRFADGGMELVVVSDTAGQKLGTDPVGKSVAKLPGDTALAAGIAIPKDFIATMLDTAKAEAVPEVDSFVAEAEDATGLKLPEDLETLLGSAITLSVGGNAPSSLSDFEDPENVPVGLVIHGDSAEVLDVIGTIEDHLGIKLSDIPIATETTDDTVVLSPSSAYAQELTKAGKLGDADIFAKAVPDADNSAGLFFLSLDGGWRDATVDFASDGMSNQESDEIAANLKPFGAFGLSTSVDQDGVSRFRLRIATD